MDKMQFCHVKQVVLTLSQCFKTCLGTSRIGETAQDTYEGRKEGRWVGLLVGKQVGGR
jgi:hypothetical protein